MGYMNDDPLIAVDEWQVQIRNKFLRELAEKHFGVELTDQECEALFYLFNVTWDKEGAEEWEGPVAHMRQAIITAIGAVISNSRKPRKELVPLDSELLAKIDSGDVMEEE